jgi:hypothetical protein
MWAAHERRRRANARRKSGHVGIVYELRGPDPEGLTHGQRRAMVHHFEAALRLLDERNRVYHYVMLIEALKDFERTMIVVSHDRPGIERRRRRWQRRAAPHAFPGTYAEYVRRTGHEAPGVHASPGDGASLRRPHAPALDRAKPQQKREQIRSCILLTKNAVCGMAKSKQPGKHLPGKSQH